LEGERNKTEDTLLCTSKYLKEKEKRFEFIPFEIRRQ
jgi:hypothetical protein